MHFSAHLNQALTPYRLVRENTSRRKFNSGQHAVDCPPPLPCPINPSPVQLPPERCDRPPSPYPAEVCKPQSTGFRTPQSLRTNNSHDKSI